MLWSMGLQRVGPSLVTEQQPEQLPGRRNPFSRSGEVVSGTCYNTVTQMDGSEPPGDGVAHTESIWGDGEQCSGCQQRLSSNSITATRPPQMACKTHGWSSNTGPRRPLSWSTSF